MKVYDWRVNDWEAYDNVGKDVIYLFFVCIIMGLCGVWEETRCGFTVNIINKLIVWVMVNWFVNVIGCEFFVDASLVICKYWWVWFWEI